MQTIYLHIGMHKTGSTAIQSAFNGFDNGQTCYADLEFENHSIPFYTAFSGLHLDYHIWKSAGLNKLRIERKKNEFLKKIQNFIGKNKQKNIIISGEDISVIPNEGVLQIHSILSQNSPRISVIIYVRDPLSFIKSDYQETIKGGWNLIRPTPPQYKNRIYKFIQIFGKDNVQIREFSRNSLKNGDVIQDFADITGISPPPKGKSDNSSLSTEAVRLIYLLNQFISTQGETASIAKARQLFVSHVRDSFPGSFDLPISLVAGLVENSDIEWLHSVSGIDFREFNKVGTEAFDPTKLANFLSSPEQGTLRTIREQLIREFGVPNPPEETRFLVARYFMCFLQAEGILAAGFDPQLYLQLNPDVTKAGVNPYQHYLEFGIQEGRRIK